MSRVRYSLQLLGNVRLRDDDPLDKDLKNDAIKIWNKSPDAIKKCVTLYAAKKAVKSFTQTLPI